MKTTLFMMMFAAVVSASVQTALPVNAWGTADECVGATGVPFYRPSILSKRAIGANEIIKGHPTGGCFRMDLPGNVTGWVRIEAGRPFVYSKADKLLRLAECNNRIYDYAHFAKEVAVSSVPVVPVQVVRAAPTPVEEEKEAEPVRQVAQVEAEAARPPQTAEQTATVSMMSGPCLVSTKGMEKNAKKKISLLCEHELAQISRQEAGTIGVAAKNKAVTKVTYRNADGTAFEASNEGAKLVLSLRKEDRKENVGIAKASQPQGCGWMGCSVGVGYVPGSYGYAGGYSYIQGGSFETSRGVGGINTVTNTGGVGWHR